MFKSIGPVELTTIYFGEGPVEKYQINGYSCTTDWATGQPKTDADYIVCAQIQVVYSRRQRHLADHLRADHLRLRGSAFPRAFP